MDRFIDAIRLSLRKKNWLSALFMALSMPDICRSIERPVIERGRIGYWYIDWFNRYLGSEYISKYPETSFTGEDCWGFRCSCLHAGIAGVNKERMSKIIFIPPLGNQITIHRNYSGNKLNLQIDIFCEDMINAVESWYNELDKTEEVMERVNSLISIGTNELQQFIELSPYTRTWLNLSLSGNIEFNIWGKY